MNMLLKIVRGPNAGAEIVLTEGMSVSLGKGDSCDIILADQSLADTACELEVIAGRVRMLLPGGAEERLEPFRVKFLGDSTALAVGPEVGAWDELAWPSPDVASPGREETPDKDTAPTATEAPSAVSGEKHRRGCGCAAAMLLLASAAAAAVFFTPPLRTRIADLMRKEAPISTTRGEPPKTAAESEVPPHGIGDIAAEYGLSCVETNGLCILSGNFRTRAQRLSATAAVYAAKSGAVLDLSDDESLRSATTEVLELLGEGYLQVHSVANRTVELSGVSPGTSSLRAVLEAIRADVPHVRNVDCTRVRLEDSSRTSAAPAPASIPPEKPAAKGIAAFPINRESRKRSAPKMPVAGVVTVPYPCIVLQDGSRITEGAEFGGFTIDKIGADTIRVRGPEGAFEWRP